MAAPTNSQATSDPSIPAMAMRGDEITGLDIFKSTIEDITPSRVQELLLEMKTDVPTGGTDMSYGPKDSQILRFWHPQSEKAPLVLFVHGGSWMSGTYLDSIGSEKVDFLVSKGYAFATVNYTLFPTVTVGEQVQEVADSLSFLRGDANKLGIDPERIVLMGHSSGAHVVTLLGTDTSYLERAGINIHSIRAVISIDGSNFNALAEIVDSPGPVADNALRGLGSDPEGLRAMSPTYHASAPNAGAFLLLQVQRQGDVRQSVEFSAALRAAGTNVALHVFEGQGFEGHIQMLLRLGKPDYPATRIVDAWLGNHVPVD